MDKIKILLAFEEIGFLEKLKGNLDAEGYDVLIAAYNEMSIGLVVGYNPDLIILDFNSANSSEVGY